MKVPYISQLDPVTGIGGNNCGPACLAMLLAYEGVIAPTRGAMLHVADVVRDGVADGRGQIGGYTTWERLQWYARELGQTPVWCGSWGEISYALAKQQPVIVLLANWLLRPRAYPQGPAFDAHHFVVLCEHDRDNGAFVVNDPLSVTTRGPVVYSAGSVVNAVDAIGAVQALYLQPRLQSETEDEMTEAQRAIVDKMAALGADDASIDRWLSKIGRAAEIGRTLRATKRMPRVTRPLVDELVAIAD